MPDRREDLVPYQSITVADGNSCPRHSGDTSGVHTLPLQGLSEEFPKVLLPFHGGPWGHQPPVGLKAQVKQLPKDGHIEIEEGVPWATRPQSLSFQSRGAANHPEVAMRRGCRGGRNHMGQEASPKIRAAGHSHDIVTEFPREVQVCWR